MPVTVCTLQCKPMQMDEGPVELSGTNKGTTDGTISLAYRMIIYF